MPGPKRTNLKGRRFGCLKVLEFDAGPYWLCRCDCGQASCPGQISVKATRLMRGLTEHCGSLGYRRDAERHKVAREKVPARRRSEIATAGGEAFAARLKDRAFGPPDS